MNLIDLKIFILFSLISYNFVCAQELNLKCQFKNGKTGLCQRFLDCDQAKKEFLLGIYPTVCDREHDLVCCEQLEAISETIEKEPESTTNSVTEVVESVECFSGKTSKQNNGESDAELIYKMYENGEIKAQQTNINFMAKIGIRDLYGDVHFYCGGVLLTPNFVLGPAHCARHKQQMAEVVQIGDYSGEAGILELIPISKIHTHPDYNETKMYNDIALYELPIPSSFTPACIWRWNDEHSELNDKVFAIGHDLVNRSQLIYMSADIKSVNYCTDYYSHAHELPEGLKESQYCLANTNITNANECKGFAGGPLFSEHSDDGFFLIGMANFISQCYSKLYPSIFTKISSYKNWLEKILF